MGNASLLRKSPEMRDTRVVRMCVITSKAKGVWGLQHSVRQPRPGHLGRTEPQDSLPAIPGEQEAIGCAIRHALLRKTRPAECGVRPLLPVKELTPAHW